MDQSKIDLFMVMNSKKFKPHQLEQIKNLLINGDESKYQLALAVDLKDPTTMLIISLLVGSFGVDRFMLNETGIGVAKLLTGGGCGIWTIIDWFLIQDKTKDYNYQLMLQALNA